MPGYFFDSSALAKHYHVEVGTAEVDRILQLPDTRHFIARIADTRKLAGLHAGQSFGLADGKLTVIQHADNLGRQDALELFDISRRIAKVSEDIAAAFHQFDFLGHFSISL